MFLVLVVEAVAEAASSVRACFASKVKNRRTVAHLVAWVETLVGCSAG